MEKQKIIQELVLSLNAIQRRISSQSFTLEKTKEFVNTADQCIQTLKNFHINDTNRDLTERMLYLIKSLKHYYNIKKSIDTRISQHNKLGDWLFGEIEVILNLLKEY